MAFGLFFGALLTAYITTSPLLSSSLLSLSLYIYPLYPSSQFFLGTDSAPHPLQAKESACGCAGCFTAHAAIELYAEAFSSVGKLSMLNDFASTFGAKFYNLPATANASATATASATASATAGGDGSGSGSGSGSGAQKIVLEAKPWTVPETLPFGSTTLRPLRAGETVAFSII